MCGITHKPKWFAKQLRGDLSTEHNTAQRRAQSTEHSTAQRRAQRAPRAIKQPSSIKSWEFTSSLFSLETPSNPWKQDALGEGYLKCRLLGWMGNLHFLDHWGCQSLIEVSHPRFCGGEKIWANHFALTDQIWWHGNISALQEDFRCKNVINYGLTIPPSSLA